MSDFEFWYSNDGGFYHLAKWPHVDGHKVADMACGQSWKPVITATDVIDQRKCHLCLASRQRDGLPIAHLMDAALDTKEQR